jgi:cytochrome c-type biogenesis protein
VNGTVGEIVFSGDLLVALPIAFLAGLVAFLSPCIVPLIPGYIAYVSGFTITADPTPADRRRVLAGILGFVGGMGVVFIALSIFFGTLGLLLLPYLDIVLRVSGVLLILLGIIFAGGIPTLQRDFLPHWKTRAGVWGSPLLGIVFAIGWVPCVGPTLVAVQTLALSAQDPARAAVLGVAYWLGLALPFVVVALLLGRILPALAWVRRHIATINVAGGVLLVLIGVLMVLGIWREFLSWAGVFLSGFTSTL